MKRRRTSRAMNYAMQAVRERARGGRLSADCRAKLAEIELHEHDLRHEAGSRKLEAGWPLHAVSAFLAHANITTTARYLNVKDDSLQKLSERRQLTSDQPD